ncbi:uncharacterized protein LOC119838926 [Zerene cesonia]|uniref:uncharacterized protein LOC119838926 n=1 Tax=Zerene cesonia TaxID=33412 RepID=UPI0018E4DD8D|nr:uncharacterized protein LOC119838926 [Zerene cesonia]
MPKCSFKDCRNVTSKTLKKDGISYFRFPRDPIQCGKWLTVVANQRGEPTYKINKSSVVCSEHFADKDMYETHTGIKRLHKSACPRKHVNEDEKPKKSFVERVAIKSSSESESSENEAVPPCPKILIVDDYTQIASVDEASSASSESPGDPHLHLLKLERIKLRKKMEAKDKEIENIRRRNQKLLKKTTSLKTALKLLKRRLYFIKRNIARAAGK